MAIIKDSSELKDIFNGLFEDGSDGKATAQPAKPSPSVSPAASQTVSLKGFLKRTDNAFTLITDGGLVFKIIPRNKPADDYTGGKQVTVTGIQQGDVIADASLTEPGASISTGNKKVKTENQAQLTDLAKSVKKFLSAFGAKISGLVTARPGYKYVDGIITKIPAIVAVVEKKTNLSSLNRDEILPSSFDNYDVEVVSASPRDLLIYRFAKENADAALVAKSLKPTLLESMVADNTWPKELAGSAEALEVVTDIDNRPPANARLDEVNEAMTLVCHVSPEGGWKTLGPFLDDTNDHLQVAMYDFSAPQIYESLKTIARRGASMKLVYDGNPAANVGKGTKIKDVKEDTIVKGIKRIAGRNFEFVKAWKGNGGICSNAYHIKVAVKDGKEFWLSSGNWQSSNQPSEDFDNNINLLPKYNREWNILVSNKKLAETYFRFIEWDFSRSENKPEAEEVEIALPEVYLPEEELEFRETARYMLFPPKKFVFTRNNPVRIQPILSPDNYMEHALKVIRSAKQKLYFQNQYIKISAEITSEYDELLSELKDKSNDHNVDCRIILRVENTNDARTMLDDLQAYGFNMSRIKLMTNTHTKGIIADSETIIIGSHNWSNSGVQFNRDASLLIYNGGVAQYYEDVFLHDWERRTKVMRDEEVFAMPSTETEADVLAENMVQLDWREYLG